MEGDVGGESGIRTHGGCYTTHAFQACALSHSAISPARGVYSTVVLGRHGGWWGGCWWRYRAVASGPRPPHPDRKPFHGLTPEGEGAEQRSSCDLADGGGFVAGGPGEGGDGEAGCPSAFKAVAVGVELQADGAAAVEVGPAEPGFLAVAVGGGFQDAGHVAAGLVQEVAAGQAAVGGDLDPGFDGHEVVALHPAVVVAGHGLVPAGCAGGGDQKGGQQGHQVTPGARGRGGAGVQPGVVTCFMASFRTGARARIAP